MKTKKQHYVPRELLRNFSCDNDEKLINIFLLNSNKLIDNVELYNQACEKYFYGEDQRLENAYSQLESLFSSALRKLKKGDIELTPEEDSSVRLFMIFQLNRTPEAIHKMNSFMNEMTKEIFRNNSMLPEELKEHLDDFKVCIKQPHEYLFALTMEIAYTVSDLKLGLIENKDETFIIGKSPVFILNPFLYALNYQKGLMGLGVKGAMVFMPISPKYIIVLYDSFAYKFNKKNGVIIPTNSDIYKFNLCQFFKTKDCVYLKKAKIEDLIKLRNESIEFRNKKEANSKRINISNDQKKYLIWTEYKQFPLEQRFDCIFITERAFIQRLSIYESIERPAITAIRLEMEKYENLKKNQM